MTDAKQPGDIEDAIEDAIGFNFRSLRTIRDIVIRPNTVFRAYAARDRVTYTPALRVWLGLISLQFLLSIFTGGQSEALRASLEANPAALSQYETLFGDNLDAAIEKMGESMSFLQVPLVGLLTALSVFVLHLLKQGLGFGARLNIAFATLTAGSLVGLASQPLVFSNLALGPAALMAIVVVYAVTFARGAPGVLADTVAGSLVKGGVFAAAVMALVVIGHTLNTIIAVVYAASTMAS